MPKPERIALEKKIIRSTQIICTTLAMSTNEKLDYLAPGDIDYLIVDEACQSVPPSISCLQQFRVQGESK